MRCQSSATPRCNRHVPQERLRRNGFTIVRQFVDADRCRALADLVRADLRPTIGPAEFEADVGYPGAPGDRAALGGDTPRRLLHAYARHPTFRHLATSPQIAAQLDALQPHADTKTDDPWCLSQCHHNCVMTKFPGYSSATLWHQDIRYWSFDAPELVSCWIALGDENQANGALAVIPGTHVLDIERGRLDRDLFLRPEIQANSALIEAAQVVELQAGDALFFHCRLFHAAGRNNTATTKLSCVFTYHRASNRPIPATRSAVYPGIPLPTGDESART